ncbi:Ig-like domain-containing protein [Nostoc sp.]|uniref:Ig-like domain-containing protein n=1 Tax=Nostoc sp. TaxID=1180 RepID=UPI002FF72C2A
MAVLWNEATNGDLSNDIRNPTALGTLTQGENIITGALPESPQDNLDVFSFDVPDGFVVEDIIVTQLNTTGFENGFNLFLTNPGGLVGSLNTSNSGLRAGDNLFDNRNFDFPGPLTAGTYTFDLRGFDTSFGANAYEFKLVVLPTNIVPVANNDTASTNEDTAVTVNVLGNDRDANGDTLRITQVNGQAVTVGSPITLASGALVTLNINGTLSFNPNGKYNSLAQGATTTQPFTYTISDGRRGTTPATATATVTITGVNDAPTAIALSNSTVTENVVAAVIGNLTVTDDTGDTQTFSLSDNRFEVVSNQLKLKSGISLDFEAEPSVSLNVTATDQGGLSKTQGFTIAVNDVVENTAPTDLALSTTTVNENVAANTVVGNFSTTDAEGGSFTYALVTGTGSGDNSAFSIVNGNQLQINSSPNFEAKSSYSIRVKTTDAGGLSFEKAIAIGVNDVNEAPTDLALSATTVNENVAANTVVGNFSTTDAEGGNFTYALIPGTGDADNSVFTIVNGNQLQINTSPNFEAKSSYNIRVKTTDAGGLSFEKAIAISVNDVNEAPTAVNDSISAYKNTPTTITASTLLANDTDLDAGTTLNIVGVSNATNGSVSLNSSGDVVFTPTKIGDASFQYTVSDGSLTSTATVAVSVGLNLNGGNGIDVLLGSDYDDLLNGNNGADGLYGNKGNDILNGGKGNDLLLGGQGNDILNGGDNADALYGGKGNDTLNGGAGADIFFFAVGDGSDTIEDFSDRTDKIGLTGGLRFGQLTISSSGSNTLISYGTETLATLTGINSSLITSADFVTI